MEIKKISRLLFALVLTAAHASADDDLRFYDVSGSSVSELAKNIQRNNVIGGGAFGYTQIKSSLKLESIQIDDGPCKVGSASFSFDIVIYMPRWTNKSSAKSCLQENWDVVWQKVKAHEDIHRELFYLLDINAIESHLMQMPAQATCAALKTVVDAELETILAENGKLHDDFHASEQVPVLESC